MAETKLLFAGFGGQGVLFMGKVAAYSGLTAGREVSWLPSYGPEMRGGTANCGVCLSDKPIGSPLVTRPEILVAMNGPSFVKFIGSVVPGGKVFTEASLVSTDNPRADIALFPVEAMRLSEEQDLSGIANMIVFGKMLGETGFASFEDVERGLRACVPPKNAHLIEHNLRAILLGMSL